MKQLKSYRYKLKPTRRQSVVLGQWLGACRYVYNLCLDYRNTLWQGYRLSLNKHAAQKELAALARETPWLACLHSQTLQEVTDRLWWAYDGFFKQGKGFPQFARRGQYRSFAFKQGVKLHPYTNTIQLPKLGKIKYVGSRSLPADAAIKQATICQQADGWYVALCVETDIAPLPVAANASIGIDVGIRALATLSTGETIANPRHLQQAQHRLARLQRAVSRKKKGSNNHRKAVKKLARQHLRVRNCRQDYLHKLTTRLIRENQAIITEQLNIKGLLKNHFLARSKAEASWGELNRQLAYKALWYGRHYEQVAPHHTSHDCSVCGYRNRELTLSIRKWSCPQCRTLHERDANAARNILAQGGGAHRFSLRATAERSRYAPVGVVAQESPGFSRESVNLFADYARCKTAVYPIDMPDWL